MDKVFGNWIGLWELGEGGQGTVYYAVKRDEAEAWAQRLCESLKSISPGAVSYGIGDKFDQVLEFAKTIEQRINGTWATCGALKVLHKEGHDSTGLEKAKKRLAAEVDALRSINHPNVIKLLAADDGNTWVVFEYFARGSLDSQIGRFKGNALSAARAILPLINGAQALHEKGHVHRDIKPANIFLADDGRLVLGDFGLVFPTDHAGSRVTSTREKTGTLDWMPTWAICNRRLERVRPTFDVFALGKLLWALIAGDPFLQMHNHSEDEFNLEKRFPTDECMRLVNEMVLSKCLVEKEASCLENASRLREEITKLIEKLEDCLKSARPSGKEASDARDGIDSENSGDASSIAAKQAIPVETLTLMVGQTLSAFDDDIFVSLITLIPDEGRYRLRVGVGSPGTPTETQYADVGQTIDHEGFEVRIMSTTSTTATFRVANLSAPF